MSSGACRALVAVLLTLVATTMLTLPAVARTERLREQSTVIYKVDPATGSIDVNIVVKLTNNDDSAFNLGTWGPIVVEERSTPRVSRGFAVGASSDLPGLWRAIEVESPVIPGGGESQNLQIAYTIDARIDQSNRAAQTPARVGEGYIYFCLVGQDTDIGLVRVEIAGKDRYKLTQSGTVMEPTSKGLKSTRSTTPGEHFTCIEGTVDGNLATTTFIGPGDREIMLQAWPEADNWLDAAEANAEPALDAIQLFLGHDIPGEGPVDHPPGAAPLAGRLRQCTRHARHRPARRVRRRWRSQPRAGPRLVRDGQLHRALAARRHGRVDRHLHGRRGLCAGDRRRVDAGPIRLAGRAAHRRRRERRPCHRGAGSGRLRHRQRRRASRMSEAQWREVIGSLLNGETKYIGSSGPAAAPTTRVDFREWLDAVDERGLVPAGKADAAYAANLEELDFAQQLLADFGIPTDPLELIKRSEARARYHQFLADAAPLGAPLSVREAMDNWLFD